MTKPGINVILKTTRTLGKPKCVNRCLGRVNFTCCGHAPAPVLSGEVKFDVLCILILLINIPVVYVFLRNR